MHCLILRFLLLWRTARCARNLPNGTPPQGVAIIAARLVDPCESVAEKSSWVYDSIAMLANRTSEQWIAQYASSHQHPVNRLCHTLGVPTILLSVPIFVASIFFHYLWPYALALFVLGWVFQFIGHAFEGKPPEFLQDWRFLFVGVRWWWAKINGKA